ncbi:MAG: carbohydrate kinase family protein [Spirochaetales bacterium]|nr:carbohydrate kinase family protein [Spirochaetales bacterium]
MAIQITCAGVYVVDFITSELSGMPGSGEIVFPKISMHIGGHSANVAINLVKLGLSKDSISTTGAVGKDILSEYIKQTFDNYGILSHLYKTEDDGTSISFIPCVKGEERRIICYEGANSRLLSEFVKKIIQKEKPLLFYIGAVGMLGEVYDKLEDVLGYAKGLGCITVVDPVIPPYKDWDILKKAASLIDIFHCNNAEAKAMTGIDNEAKVVKQLLSLGIKLPVVSTGEKGLVFGYNDALYTVPPFNVAVVEATGAGDAFCAGVMKKIIDLKGESLVSAFSFHEDELTDVILYGAATGAACVTAAGTTTHVDEQRVDELIKTQGRGILKGIEAGKLS